MKLCRVVVRLADTDKKALDRLRGRYFEETGKGLSRAAVVRALVRGALAGADSRKATAVLVGPEIATSSLRACAPPKCAEIEVPS